jgi:hypothetical protein
MKRVQGLLMLFLILICGARTYSIQIYAFEMLPGDFGNVEGFTSRWTLQYQFPQSIRDPLYIEKKLKK